MINNTQQEALDSVRKIEDTINTIDTKEAKFKKRLAVYIVFSVFFVVLNLFTIYLGNGGYFWAIYPILGWGISIAIQFFIGKYR